MTVEIDLDEVNRVMCRALEAGMNVIRPYQLGKTLPKAEIKTDGSVVTSVDKLSEAKIVAVFRSELPDIPILGEEGGTYGDLSGVRYLVVIDPYDGTLPGKVGAFSSTVILGLFDRLERRIVFAMVGSPISGQIWTAYNGRTTFRWIENGKRRTKTCQVWDGDISPRAVVFIDNFAGLPGKPALTTKELAAITAELNWQVGIENHGSNGFHHALLALGNELTAGIITGAFGGPWDAFGVLLITLAGGVAQGFAILPDGTLEERDPLDPFSYHFLVAANNHRSLEVIVAGIKTGRGKARAEQP